MCEHCNNHEMRRTPSEPSANKPPPLHLRGARELHKGGGCAPRTGRCTPRGWQQGRDQPTACGTVNVVRRREIRIHGGRWVGQEWVRKRGTQERQQTGEEQHRYKERGTHTRRDEGEHSRQGGGAQQGRRGHQDREPEWRGWESVRMGGDNKGDGLASQPRCYRVPGQPLLNQHQVGGVSRSPDGLFAQQEREPTRGRPAMRGKGTYGGRSGQRVEEQGTWASRTQKHSEAGYGRRVDSKNSQTTLTTTSTTSIRQLLGATDSQTAHHATFSTAPAHQLLGSANAEMTPARATAAATESNNPM